jgi:hypothetical protein
MHIYVGINKYSDSVFVVRDILRVRSVIFVSVGVVV